MLPNLKKETEDWTGEEGEFIMDYCILAESHSLENKIQNNIVGYIVGFEKDRVCFLTGEDINCKIITIKLKNVIIKEDFKMVYDKE